MAIAQQILPAQSETLKDFFEMTSSDMVLNVAAELLRSSASAQKTVHNGDGNGSYGHSRVSDLCICCTEYQFTAKPALWTGRQSYRHFDDGNRFSVV
jgi:hypothetical protein